MLNQPSNITPDEVFGTGTVDLTQGLTVSWRIGGTSPLTAYQVTIYSNDTASTQLLTSGKVTLATPVWGVSYDGETQFQTATFTAAQLSAAGVTNGNEYKLLITQWWSGGSVDQITASVFQGRTTPTLTLGTIPNPLTTKANSFTATYTQAQGDGVKWVRWQISEASDTDNPFLDTGPIYGTGDLRVDYDGFLFGAEYAICCTVESSSGQEVTTGWNTFAVQYAVSGNTGNVTACVVRNECCVLISWEALYTADGYSVMRQTVGTSRLEKIADVPANKIQLKDYSAKSGVSYIYYVFPAGPLAYLTEPMVSDEINVQYWMWTIVEAQETSKNYFSWVASHVFRYGPGGVSEGQFSNNNSPNVVQTFTPYPARQGSSANYLSGSVSGYIGTVSSDLEYADTIAQSSAIFELSQTTNTLFLLDPKGHFLRINTSGALTLNIDNKKVPMPQSMTIPWVEVGSTENVHVTALYGENYNPTDRIIFTTVTVNPKTGKLIWTVPDNYEGTGTELSLVGGFLNATQTEQYSPATLSLDTTTMILSADAE